MKKVLSLILAVMLVSSLLVSACADGESLFSLTTNGGKEINTLQMPHYLLGAFDPVIADYPEEAAAIVEEAEEYYPVAD